MLTLRELLLAEDEQFVRLAYQAVLGRPADETGLAAYLAELRDGSTKTRLLVDMATSDEARRHAPTLPGLDQLVAQHRRHPLIRARNRLWRLLFPDSGNAARETRALRNELYRRQVALEQRIEAVERLLTQSADASKVMFGRLLNQLETASPSAAFYPPAAAAPSGRVVFNLTTSLRWRSRAVGIIRVERELAACAALLPDTAFVVWDDNSGSFSRLSRSESAEILGPRWLDPASGVADFRELRTPYELHDTDVYVSVGLDWDVSPIHRIAALLRASGCRSVFACHDLVPIFFPEYCVEEGFDQRFKRHFVDMAHVADAVVSVSDNSQRDLLDFWRSAELEVVLPHIETIPLASLPRRKRLPTLMPFDIDRLRHLKAHSPYVLYVSSIESRKNHRLLLGVWRDLFRERDADCPMLVLVGMSGWGTEDLLAQMRRSPASTAGKIVVLNDVNDDLLQHLYSSCCFSVFPSEYEGWGLAATESMALGKVCLIADTGGLKQATQGLMPALHPRDHFGWKASIERLLDDSSHLRELEDRIRREFVYRSWSEVSDDWLRLWRALARPAAAADGADAKKDHA